MAKAPRIAPITEQTASPEQRRVGDAIYGGREPFGGPSAVLLHAPELAEIANRLRRHIRAAGLRDDLVQLATLIAARHWSADYVWTIREQFARDAGIDAAAIAAIRHRQHPAFADADQEAIYTYVMELLGPVGIADATHARAVAVLGETGVIELVAAVSLYTMLALVARAADLPVQPGSTPLAR
jgi:4-carboxymuconolactone decarboxylase